MTIVYRLRDAQATAKEVRGDALVFAVVFGIIERQATHRGTFGSVKDLNTKIRAFINGWNDRRHPFVWTNTADKISRKPTVRILQTHPTSRLAAAAM